MIILRREFILMKKSVSTIFLSSLALFGLVACGKSSGKQNDIEINFQDETQYITQASVSGTGVACTDCEMTYSDVKFNFHDCWQYQPNPNYNNSAAYLMVQCTKTSSHDAYICNTSAFKKAPQKVQIKFNSGNISASANVNVNFYASASDATGCKDYDETTAQLQSPSAEIEFVNADKDAKFFNISSTAATPSGRKNLQIVSLKILF